MDERQSQFDKPKIKIIAIAKDEGAYISEWIHHHLYFGFDAIEIHINRTSDNSIDIINTISNVYPEVSWQSADWVDMCSSDARKHMQFIVYASALAELRKNGEFSHVFFLDIDEFWCPSDLTLKIQDYLLTFPSDHALFFEWLNDLGDLPEFSSIPKNLKGNPSPLGKTLLPANADIVEIRNHVSLLKDKSKVRLANGTLFQGRPKMQQALLKELSGLKDAFIYHRAHRSQLEYISLVFRGRPGNEFKYKNNRAGLPNKDKPVDTVLFPDSAYALYQTSLQSFLQKVQVEDLLPEAIDYVKTRYVKSINNIKSGLQSNYEDMMKIFSGVHSPQVIEKFSQYREEKVRRRPKNVPLIRQFALDARHQNIDEAIALMKKAKTLRPENKIIANDLTRFESMKSAPKE
ncbi:glycosyltransferase family 2 protein [Alteromonas sp. 5E99-2]|uniref:glycosyltransferase family 2 protein n=1 Tax=Alteromonas sp. 5E99-2 TaxID=2817683 RepID=UPI001A9924D8|nr:glycosyltransferase family 2 protein [Alteromonas sp. 5E99-2]MBO1256397.1 glycosyltransferase family 2 protein [Alteromonas sp. 5E99-2]